MALPAPPEPVLLLVAGASGSGKSTLAEELARELEGTHFHIDHYYRDLSHMPLEERAQQNFDDPQMIDYPLLLRHLQILCTGGAVDRPCYDFATHTRIPHQTESIREPHLLVLDGIFALHWPAIRALASLSVYVDTPDDICFGRRLRRDVQQRGRSPEGVQAHYDATVRPMAEKYVRPSARWADVIVDGTSSLDWSIEQVLHALRALEPAGMLELEEASDMA